MIERGENHAVSGDTMNRNPQTSLLLEIVDRAYDHLSWHGTTLRGAVRGVRAREASWRPAPNRHSIHELVLHAAYWKYAAWRKLTDGTRGTFPVSGSNWFACEPVTEKEWKAAVELMDRMHAQLRAVVERLEARDLATRAGRSRYSKQFLITGVAAHDLYHGGQIQLLKRLQGETKGTRPAMP
jgi:hypothetical protein